MDIEQILQKVDTFFAENKGIEAEAVLQRGVKQAVEEGDQGSLLRLLNELMGYYRETSQVEASFQIAQQALKLAQNMGLRETIPYATTLQNAANAYRAGGRIKDSFACYEQAEAIYQELLEPKDMLWASLENNKSLLYQEQGDFQSAKACLAAAAAIVREHAQAWFEEAVTYTNLASTCFQCGEDQEAADYASKALQIFQEHKVEDAHSAAAWASLGTYAYQKGSFQEAAGYFRTAMEQVNRALGENQAYQRLSENLSACLSALGNSQPEEGTGLKLCREYYETFGEPMIKKRFADYIGKIATGLVGEGSDCFGLDDALSQDHDWGPGFCIWVTDETYQAIGKELEAAYQELPCEFKGYKRNTSDQGRGRMGVHTIETFYQSLIGSDKWDAINWAQAEDASLAAAVNGAVFRDEEGVFTAFRHKLEQGYPESIKYLKIAQSSAGFSQAGQYNYQRMLKRKDTVSAFLMAANALREAMKLYHYLNDVYPIHDKWLFQNVKNLESRNADEKGKQKISQLVQEIILTLTGEQRDNGNKAESNHESSQAGSTEEKTHKVSLLLEELAEKLAFMMYQKGYTSDINPYLEAHTQELLQKSSLSVQEDSQLVEAIIRMEFHAFDKVHNEGGRAACQDDWPTFHVMRKSQYMTWNRTMLLQYLYDFQREWSLGHNLIEEKYGRMMESTAPEEFAGIQDSFPPINDSQMAIIQSIVAIQVDWMEEFESRYPILAGNARSIRSSQDNLYNTSYETYLKGEISTYSDKMLELYGRYVAQAAAQHKNLAFEIMENNVKLYGYSSLEEAEQKMY